MHLSANIGNITKSDPRVWAVLASLLISLVISSLFFINNDGIFYLLAAEDVLLHGSAATHVGLKWPLYPLLIAGLSYVTHLPLTASALIWQAFFQVILVISFINIVRVLGGNKTIQVLAAAVIILHPTLNEYRSLIIRDFGYWAFLLTGFYYLLRYSQYPSWGNVLAWLFSVGLATLFRIEGVVIIALSPLLLFFVADTSWKTKLKLSFNLYLPWLVVACAIVLFLLFKHQNLSAFGRLAELDFWWNYFSGSFFLQWDNMEVNIEKIMHPAFGSMSRLF